MSNRRKGIILCISVGLLLVFLAFLPERLVKVIRVFAEITASEDQVLKLWSMEDYLWFAEAVRGGDTFKNTYVDLCADLDFSGVEENPAAGNAEHHFEGIFDGNGHCIKNLVIQSENAGLFVGLKGTVANLVVESGNVEGERCGAIASDTEPTARILNCASWAEISGETYNGISGDDRAVIRNCAGSRIETTLEILNRDLSGLDASYGVDGFSYWEQEDKPVLRQETAGMLLSIEASPLELDGSVTLKAYYAWDDHGWHVVIPRAYADMNMQVVCRYDSGMFEKLLRNQGMQELFWKHGNDRNHILFQKTGQIPVLMMETKKGLAWIQENKENSCQGSYRLFSGNGEQLANGMLEEISGHGNDSWKAEKKSYNLTFQKSADLLGIGNGQKYVLLAGYRDNSLMAYKVTNDMAKDIGMAYAPESEMVHVYVDGNYLGLYLLTGKIEIGEHRFALKDLPEHTKKSNPRSLKDYECVIRKDDGSKVTRVWYELPRIPEDLTGGYILELTDDYDWYKSRFISERGISMMLKSQPYAAKEQVDYIADLWQEFENALFAEDGVNEKGRHYSEYIDMESFADQWLFYELNEENSLGSSVYFYKDSDETGDGRIHASWMWDLEHSLARSSAAAMSWFTAVRNDPDDYWAQFYRHSDFRELVYKEWQEKFLPAIEKALDADTGENPDGVSSLDWYLEAYGEDGALENDRWSSSNPEEKLEKIRKIYEIRKEFLSRSLSRYESREYEYYYEQDGNFYGVKKSGGEDILMELP